MRRGGWFGNSQGHALAARGIRMYAAKRHVAEMFYVVKHEREMPSSDVAAQIRAGKLFFEIAGKHPGHEEEIRQKGIKAVEALDADATLSTLDRQKVESIVLRAQMSPQFREKARGVLDNAQRRSFLKQEKATLLDERLKAK
jgi:hypothetical protein